MVLDRRRAFRCVLSFNYIPQSQTRVTQFCVLQLLSTCCYSFTAAAAAVHKGVGERNANHNKL